MGTRLLRIREASDWPDTFQPGDVAVVGAGSLGTRTLRQSILGGSDPVTIVGEAFFNQAVADDNIRPSDLKTHARARSALRDKALRADHQARVGALMVAPLTPIRVEQLQFSSGHWFFAGFDILAITRERHQFELGHHLALRSTRAVLAHNRFSNRTADGDWLWNARNADGSPRNGGVLVRTFSTATDSMIANTVFEDLRGYLCVSVGPGTRGVRVIGNTFRSVPRWQNNAGEAVHVGFSPRVSAPHQEPIYQALGARVERNLFERFDGDPEVIGVKVAHNIIRHNHIIDCAGALSLRGGADNLVEHNVLVRSGGLRILGERQTVRHNVVVLPSDGYGLWLEGGAQRAAWHPHREGNFLWHYRAAADCVVHDNRIIVPHQHLARAVSVRPAQGRLGFAADGSPISARAPTPSLLAQVRADNHVVQAAPIQDGAPAGP